MRACFRVFSSKSLHLALGSFISHCDILLLSSPSVHTEALWLLYSVCGWAGFFISLLNHIKLTIHKMKPLRKRKERINENERRRTSGERKRNSNTELKQPIYLNSNSIIVTPLAIWKKRNTKFKTRKLDESLILNICWDSIKLFRLYLLFGHEIICVPCMGYF